MFNKLQLMYKPYTIQTKAPLCKCYTCFVYESITGEVRILVIFNTDLCSATSMEISSRDLSNDMAEHRPISKNNQNTHYSLIFQD